MLATLVHHELGFKRRRIFVLVLERDFITVSHCEIEYLRAVMGLNLVARGIVGFEAVLP